MPERTGHLPSGFIKVHLDPASDMPMRAHGYPYSAHIARRPPLHVNEPRNKMSFDYLCMQTRLQGGRNVKLFQASSGSWRETSVTASAVTTSTALHVSIPTKSPLLLNDKAERMSGYPGSRSNVTHRSGSCWLATSLAAKSTLLVVKIVVRSCIAGAK